MPITEEREKADKLEKYILVFILSLICGYGISLEVARNASGDTKPIPTIIYMIPGVILGLYYFLRKRKSFQYMQGLYIGFTVFLFSMSMTGRGWENGGLSCIILFLCGLGIGLLFSEVLKTLSSILVWFSFLVFTVLNSVLIEQRLNIGLEWEQGAAIVPIWIVITTGIVVFVRGNSKEARSRSFGLSIVRAPDRPSLTDTFQVQGDLGEVAKKALTVFEEEVEAHNAGEFKTKSILYFDGLQSIPLYAVDNGKTLEIDDRGVRSEAYCVRRGFDEWWFVLHIKGHEASMSIQLDVKQRTQNFLGPLLLIGAIGFPVVAWLAGSQVAKVGILVLVGLGWLQHLGILEILFNKERGDKRREERLREYLPTVGRAAATAIEAAKASTLRSSGSEPPQQQSAPQVTKTTDEKAANEPVKEQANDDVGWTRE